MKYLVVALAVAFLSVSVNAQDTVKKETAKKEHCSKGKKSCSKDKKAFWLRLFLAKIFLKLLPTAIYILKSRRFWNLLFRLSKEGNHTKLRQPLPLVVKI